MPFLASEGCFWPLTASKTWKVKNNYAYVITQDICNKLIEVNFYVGCMVSQPNRLLQRLTTMSLINKMCYECFVDYEYFDGSNVMNLINKRHGSQTL